DGFAPPDAPTGDTTRPRAATRDGDATAGAGETTRLPGLPEIYQADDLTWDPIDLGPGDGSTGPLWRQSASAARADDDDGSTRRRRRVVPSWQSCSSPAPVPSPSCRSDGERLRSGRRSLSGSRRVASAGAARSALRSRQPECSPAPVRPRTVCQTVWRRPHR